MFSDYSYTQQHKNNYYYYRNYLNVYTAEEINFRKKHNNNHRQPQQSHV